MKRLHILFFISVSGAVAAQSTVPGIIGQSDDFKTITTAVPFLNITPDTRSAGLGDAGAALSPDANSAYWNAGKLAFLDRKAGLSTSYTPWLAKIINDMRIYYVAGYYKLNRTQAIAASLKYFDMGEVNFTDNGGVSTGNYNPRDVAFDVTYSRMLSENLGIGGTIRYIYSNLTGGVGVGTSESKPGQSVAVDLGVYYTKELVNTNSDLSLAASVSNIGSKMSYTDGDSKNFIPANLRLGAAYKMILNPNNDITVLVDFSKLMVPSPTEGSSSKSLLSGTFGSFGDADGGFSEEIKEVMVAMGAEYWFREMVAGRLGYFNEAYQKGNRKYMTAGVGFKNDKIGLDIAYMFPVNKNNNALAETIRFTLFYTFPGTTEESPAPTQP